MKIIVLDCVNGRIEVLNVPEQIIEDGDIEFFLSEQDYSLNNIL